MPARHPLLEQAVAYARTGRTTEAFALLERLAEAEEPEALYFLAEACWVGGPVPRDMARGRDLFRRGSDAGHPLARQAYTNLVASGIAGARSWPNALDRLAQEGAADPGRARMRRLIEAMALDSEGDPAAIPVPETLSLAPAVSLIRGAVSPGECGYLQALAEPRYQPALVRDAWGIETRDPVRTADGSTIHWLIEDPTVHALNRRLARLTGTRVEQGEPLQILRYAPGQEYRPHMDWDGGDNSRMLTALVYLNEDYAGGETLFPKTGLKVKGGRGDVLVFRSIDASGAPDPLSEHAGLPVASGVKYLASRWIHERRYTG